MNKKILFYIFFVILLNSLYILTPWGIMATIEVLREGSSTYTFFGFSYLTITIFIVQSILLFMYFFKGFSKNKLIMIFLITLFFHSALALVPFNNECSQGLTKNGYKNCSCIGIEKNTLFRSQCLGIREECYLKGVEKPCDEVFPKNNGQNF